MTGATRGKADRKSHILQAPYQLAIKVKSTGVGERSLKAGQKIHVPAAAKGGDPIPRAA